MTIWSVIGSDLVQSLSGSYVLGKDTVEATCYANLVCNFLYNTNKIDAGGKMGVNLALTEMLVNAIEHGNCGITYEEKSAWLEDGGSMRALLAARSQAPQIAARRVLLEYDIKPRQSTFVIADQGDGFDRRSVADGTAPDALQRLHGRGITLTRRFARNLRYNDKGNTVTFEIEHLQDCTNALPALFEDRTPLHVAAGEIVLREGTPGNFLYYIVKGHFDVTVKGVKAMSLSPDDIVMGEMSFLLDNRRSATVQATTPGTLIRLSKREFVEAPRSRDIFSFHRPETLRDMAENEKTLRGQLREMPEVPAAGLWAKQHTAIVNVEKSLRLAKPRALIQMATGSGKTFTAANIAYRLIRYGHAHRVCFLVDRTNRGIQTTKEFQQFLPPGERQTLTSSTTSPSRARTVSTRSTALSSRPSSAFIPS